MHGTVSFTVAANDTEQQRSAGLTIIYEYAEGKSVDASVSITQAVTEATISNAHSLHSKDIR